MFVLGPNVIFIWIWIKNFYVFDLFCRPSSVIFHKIRFFIGNFAWLLFFCTSRFLLLFPMFYIFFPICFLLWLPTFLFGFSCLFRPWSIITKRIIICMTIFIRFQLLLNFIRLSLFLIFRYIIIIDIFIIFFQNISSISRWFPLCDLFRHL